jgi:hypothetical protein
MFQTAIGQIFSIGRGQSNRGKVITNGDVDDVARSIRQTKSGIGPIRSGNQDVDLIKKVLGRLPSGEPFAGLEDMVNTPEDAEKFMKIRDLTLDILNTISTERKLRGLADIPNAFDDFERSVTG